MTPKNGPATAGEGGKGQGKNTRGKEKATSPDTPRIAHAKKSPGPQRQTPAATRGLLLRQDRSALSQLARRRANDTPPASSGPTPAAVGEVGIPTTGAPGDTSTSSGNSRSASPIASTTASASNSGDDSTNADTSTIASTSTLASTTPSNVASEAASAPPRKRARKATSPAPVVQPQPDTELPSLVAETRPAKRARTSTSTPASAPKTAAGAPDQRLDEKKAVTFYIDTTLRKRLKLFADKKRMSQTLVTLHALSLPDATLAELVEQDQQSQVVESLDRFGVILKPRGDLNEAKQQVGMRMTPRQLQVIDELRDRTGARDRSHLINLALRAYLDQN